MELSDTYDKFVKDYGYITGRGNSMAFRMDADYPLLCSLEIVDEDGNVEKAEMFTKQTIKAKQEITHVETAVEALAQIERKNYAAELQDLGFTEERIKKYGFAFEGKKVLILRGDPCLTNV